VAKASRESILMLVVAPEWTGHGYQWWSDLCALCPKKWCLPEGRPVYLRGGTVLMPAPRWKTWAFLLDSRPLQPPGPTAPPPDLDPVPPPTPPGCPCATTRARNS